MKKLISIISIFAIIICFPITSNALSWVGDSSIGGSVSSSTNAEYSVPYSTYENNILGYRFSVIDSDGTTKYVKDLFGSSTYLSGYNQYLTTNGEIQNKYQLITSFGTSYGIETMSRTIYSSLSGVSPDEILSFAKGNLDTILKLIGLDTGSAGLNYGDRLVIEPIFAVYLDRVKMCCTVSDYAAIASGIFGKTTTVFYASGQSSGGSAVEGTWAFISLPLLIYFPNMLYTNT